MPLRPTVRPGLLGRPASFCSTLVLRPFSNGTNLASNKIARAPAKPSGGDDIQTALELSVPPDSPRYVRFPTPPQSDEQPRPVVKGHLPVPRNIFRKDYIPGRRKDNEDQWVKKTDIERFSANATPVAKAVQNGEAPWNEYQAMRRRLAENRRQGLQAGLRGLLQRQVEKEHRAKARSTNLANRNRRLALYTPERRDEILTRSSVRESTAKNTTVIRDPLRHEKLAASAERTAALAQQRKEERRDALMELYQAAGKFIVDEEELEKRVSELFRPDYFKEEGYSYGTVNAENIWDVVGKPNSVRELMQGITRTETKLFDAKRSELDRTTKRQKLVAEALTGGKMPV
ncbi:hypothetical protein Sste5346_000246 [Sporothrix stenoceras]|uniref:37S ribosomal protein n=1 Tax=Sporothrix stenoceras TaxID=5173 RepID=A0ABR3ZUE2_9PEZI